MNVRGILFDAYEKLFLVLLVNECEGLVVPDIEVIIRL